MEDNSYFSESENPPPPRDRDDISSEFWRGFAGLISSLVNDGSFAESFPSPCYDTPLPMDCDRSALGSLFIGENPHMTWPLHTRQTPKTLQALDAVQFFYRHISRVTQRYPHTSRSLGYQHDHFTKFDRSAGQADYLRSVNTLFRRCRHPYELQTAGKIIRLVPPVLREELLPIIFNTGDSELDRLLNTSREKFMSPDAEIRSEGLEKLWDAWERLKTCFSSDKKISSAKLLERAVPEQNLRERIEEEAKSLTYIGNNFMIRHTETNKPRIERPEQVDYLYHRLFALIHLLLRSKQL
jgi:hypothetical protein